MPLTDAEKRDALAFRVAGVSAGAACAPVLHWRRAGDAYAAGDSCVGTVSTVDRAVTVCFHWQDAPDADFIELEIPAVAGIYRVERFRIGGVDVVDLARRVVATRDRLLDAVDASLLRFAADAGRPRVEIDVRGLDARRPGVVEADIVREDGALELRMLLQHGADAVLQQVRRQGIDLGESALAHGAELRRLGAILSGHGEDLGSLEDALGELRRESARSDDHARAALLELTQLAAQARDANGERQAREDAAMARLATALEALSERQVHALQRLDTLQTEVRHLQWSIENVFWRRWLRRLRAGGT